MPQDFVNPCPEATARLPVVVDAPPRAASPAAGRPMAPVVAQLLGALHDCPQYRARRRERPEIAGARYRAAAALATVTPRLDRRD
jgi:hypothetical protein